MWEELFCKLIWGKRVQKKNNKWYDILLPSQDLSEEIPIECKIWRIGNSVVIKKRQLDEMNKVFCALVYYRTTWNLPPTYFISKKADQESEWLVISPEAYLKKISRLNQCLYFQKSL